MGEKNLFVVHFAVQLALKLLAKRFTAMWFGFLFGGPAGFVVGYFAEKLLNFMVNGGILILDLTQNSITVALEEKEFHDAAEKAYKRATSGVKTEAEKIEIRKEYLAILAKFASVGDGVRSPGDS